jgi:hypothetical protein
MMIENINQGVAHVFELLKSSNNPKSATQFYRKMMLIIAPDRCGFRENVDPNLYDALDEIVNSNTTPKEIKQWKVTLEKIKILFSNKVDKSICGILATSINNSRDT